MYRTTTQQDGLRGEANPQVEGIFKASPQVVEAASRTLSRWRHGFKSRWDYKERRRSDNVSSLNGESARPFVPHSSVLSRGSVRPRRAAAACGPTTCSRLVGPPPHQVGADAEACGAHRMREPTRAHANAASRGTSIAAARMSASSSFPWSQT
jgi:hypothetical protein